LVRNSTSFMATNEKYAKVWGKPSSHKGSKQQWIETLESRYQDAKLYVRRTEMLKTIGKDTDEECSERNSGNGRTPFFRNRSCAPMVKILPELQAALDAMQHSDKSVLTFLTTDHGKAFASAAAFGNKFADWCRAAGLRPVLCDDGKMRSYRAQGLRKASLLAYAHAGATDQHAVRRERRFCAGVWLFGDYARARLSPVP
jgi:hypothetical protein